jgi:hypothetical protein
MWFESIEDEPVKPTRVWERSLVTPDVRTFVCQATPSAWVDVLDYYAEFDGDVSEEVREYWEEQFNYTGPVEGYYVHYYDVFDASGRPKWRYVEQGEDNEEDAREYAQGNHLV